MRKFSFYSGVLSTAIISQVAVQQVQAQVTPEQIATVRNVTSSAISDNGEFVAYTLSIPTDPKKENSGNKSALYILNTKTGQTTPFFTSANVSQIAFRPNKGTVTFITRKDGDKTNGVYEINLNGGEARKVFSHTNNIASYNWSPDGESIAFISVEKGKTPKTSLTYSPTFFEEEYNNRPAYIVNVMDETAKPTQLNVPGQAYMMEWSPNGQQMVVSVAPTAAVDDSYMKQSIKVLDIKGNKVVGEIENAGKLGQITWSPDSKSIALVSAYDINDPTNGSLFIVDAKGGKPTVIDANFLGKFESIAWTEPNAIYFLASEGTSTGIGKITTDGKKQYIHKADDQAITSFAVNNKGAISFTASTPTYASELFTITDVKKGKAARRTNNNAWLEEVKLGKQEVVTYKSRDGKYDLQGMLIYPTDYKAGTKVPLITVVHGGPESHYSNGWITGYSNPGQMAAGEGYAVFYPNYRGSTGRGTEFTYSSQADLAGKEFDDIVDGVDYLIAQGIVDKNRVGVTGGSYGGYASAWMSTYYSDRFAAAVMFVGISNNISKFGTSDIPTEMALVHERGNVWDNWQKQLEISPIYHVDKANTPILIMHGAEDPRVHPAQSMELYRHIKVRKPEVPVRLVYYPGEGHGNARSGSKYDYNKRMMQWFDVYLKTGDRTATMPSLDLPE